ncbi:MAG: glycosyl hydrolase, partial [Planctomycetota bacterium]
MKPGVTEKFLEITLEPYRKRFEDKFGKRLPGVFTDEPNILVGHMQGVPWTDILPERFKKRWGYSIVKQLPKLFKPIGDFKRVRHNFYQLLNDLFIENWAKPYYEYCDKYGLEFTGHYFEHCWPWTSKVPDNMAMYVWMHRPGIDLLMNYYDEGTGGHLGNVRMVKELGSVANQMGRKRTLCETYGAGGWDLRFEDMKRTGDFIYVHGVNTLDEHYSIISMRGSRKRDHPQYFSHQAPWWEAYHKNANYFSRLSVALSHGEEINKVLLIEPTTTVWMYQAEKMLHPNQKKIGDPFQQLVVALSKAQVEYDIGSEYLIEHFGSVKDKRLVVGQRSYKTVIISPRTENLNIKTVGLLEKYLKNGGSVLCCGGPPVLLEGVPSDRCRNLAKMSGWRQVEAEAVPGMLLASSDSGLSISRTAGDKGILYHHRRSFDDSDLLFMVNTSIESPTSGSINGKAGSVEQWDPETGEIRAYPFGVADGRVTTDFELPPCGSLMLFLAEKGGEPVPVAKEEVTVIKASGAAEIRRLEPNVLTLDYLDLKIKEESWKDIFFFPASQFVFKKHGIAYRLWEREVQFRDELIKMRFPADSGFEATYRFTISEQIPESLFIVVERPELYSITCNGKPISAKPGDWWMDRSFGKLDIRSAVKLGQNAVSIKASPLTVYHELEPAYVIGDFSLKAVDSGFVMVPARELKLGPWNEQGYPLYGHSVSYKQTFNVGPPSGAYRVSLLKWYGSVAKVTVNGELVDYITHAPWECEVTDKIKTGENVIEVMVIGTPKNPLGPHHKNPPLGRAWPHGFINAPRKGP